MCRHLLDDLSETLCSWICCLLCHRYHGELVPDDPVYHQVEYCDGDWILLSHVSLALKRAPKVSNRPIYHWQAVPVTLKEADWLINKIILLQVLSGHLINIKVFKFTQK